MPSDIEIAYGVLRRDAENLLCGMGLDVRGDYITRMAWEKILQRYDGQIRGFVGFLASDPPDSVDVGCEVIREEIDARASDLAKKMKEKLRQKKEQHHEVHQSDSNHDDQ